MKKALAIVTVLMLIVGCAAHPVQKRVPSPRILYRDLTQPKPKADPVSKPKGLIAPDPGLLKPAGCRPEHFVAFANDSTRRFDEDGLKAFLAGSDPEAHLLVVGHSHGKSAVGTLGLASRRAQTIAQYLTRQGYAHVHLMAAWGSAPVGFAPSRGVHIYVIGPAPDPAGVPVILTREVLPGDLKEKDPEGKGPGRKRK